MELTPTPQLLLIHDQKTVKSDYSGFFDKNGWAFDCISDLSQGIKAARDNNYEIIITDLDLPGISCQTFLDQIREHRPNQAIMIVSSANKAEEAIRALRSGAVDFLQKPIDQRFLQETIVRIVNCLRENEAHSKLLKCLSKYQSSYTFTAKILANNNFIPPILNELYLAGIIDLNLKLKITLALQEAMANSLEHGNLELASDLKDEFDDQGEDLFTKTRRERLEDPHYGDRLIIIEPSYDQGYLSFTIKDQGRGFDAPNSHEIDFSDEVSLLFYGRGLRIIFGSMDKVLYEDGGTKVTISKKII